MLYVLDTCTLRAFVGNIRFVKDKLAHLNISDS